MSLPTSRPVLCAGGVLVDLTADEPQVLLIQRGNPPNAGSWTLPGGRVELGERIAAAVARELREETGLEVEVGPLLELVEIIEGPHHFVIADHACRRTGGELRAGDDAAAVRFVPIEGLDALGVTALVRQVVQKALVLLGV